MKGGNEGVRGEAGAVICVHPVRPPAIDTYTYGLYVKSLLHTRRTPTISVEERVAPGEEGTKYLQFSRENFPMRGRKPAAEGLARSPRTPVSEKCAALNSIYRFAFWNASPDDVYCGRLVITLYGTN